MFPTSEPFLLFHILRIAFERTLFVCLVVWFDDVMGNFSNATMMYFSLLSLHSILSKVFDRNI